MSTWFTVCDLCCGCRHKAPRALCVRVGHRWVCRACVKELDAELDLAVAALEKQAQDKEPDPTG
jgi:hypothetical protein